jgi:septal ring-binding cell division protein DamX
MFERQEDPMPKNILFKMILGLASFMGMAAVLGFLVGKVTDQQTQLAPMAAAKQDQMKPNKTAAVQSPESSSRPRIKPLNPKRFTVEIATFYDLGTADNYVKELRKKDVHAYYTPMQSGGRVAYYVRLGLYGAESDAKRIAGELTSAHGLEATVRKL